MKLKSRLSFVSLAVAVISLSFVEFASAQSACGLQGWAAPSIPTHVNVNAGDPVDLGNLFTAKVTDDVCALGVYDGVTLTGSDTETVGLYNAAGSLIASGTVGASSPVIDGYYWVAISPTLITEGQEYDVVVEVGENAWSWNTSAPTTSSEVTFNGTDYVYSATLEDPVTHGNLNYSQSKLYLGGDIMIPEGGAAGLYLLLAGSVCFGAMLLKRKELTA